jgi:hypothetical protein
LDACVEELRGVGVLQDRDYEIVDGGDLSIEDDF